MTDFKRRVIEAAKIYVYASGTVAHMTVPRSTVAERAELWEKLRDGVSRLSTAQKAYSANREGE